MISVDKWFRISALFGGDMKALLLSLVLIIPAFAANQPKDWNTGRVIQFDKHHWVSYEGSTTTGSVGADGNFTGNTSSSTVGHNTYYLTLDGGDQIYFASRTLSWRWQKDPLLTENADIRWRLEGNNLIILGEKDKEFKMHLDKKRKK